MFHRRQSARTIGLPADPALRKEVEQKIVGLELQAKLEFHAEVLRLRKIRSLKKEYRAIFNGRYHVLIREPEGAPAMVLVYDSTDDDYVLADLCERVPMVHLAIERCAQAIGQKVETQHIYHRR